MYSLLLHYYDLFIVARFVFTAVFTMLHSVCWDIAIYTMENTERVQQGESKATPVLAHNIIIVHTNYTTTTTYMYVHIPHPHKLTCVTEGTKSPSSLHST